MSDRICGECKNIITNKKKTAKFCSVRCYRLNIKSNQKKTKNKEEIKENNEVTMDITLEYLTDKIDEIIKNHLNNVMMPKLQEIKNLIEKQHGP